MDRYQRQRFEFKYIIPEDKALAVRDFVSAYLVIDEFGARFPDLSYPVHTLYLDSDRLTTYMATINGDKNRYKLRIRYYQSDDDSPVFFEIKRRNDNVISKVRCRVRRPSVTPLLDGRAPSTDDLVEPSAREREKLEQFCLLLRDIDARPRSQVSYKREAWLPTTDNSVRVTMDRQVHTGPDPGARMSTSVEGLPLVFGDQVILELKFTNRFPDWLREMVRVFQLVQVSAAKYVEGVIVLGEETLMPGGTDALVAMDENPAGTARRLYQRHENFRKLPQGSTPLAASTPWNG